MFRRQNTTRNTMNIRNTQSEQNKKILNVTLSDLEHVFCSYVARSSSTKGRVMENQGSPPEGGVMGNLGSPPVNICIYKNSTKYYLSVHEFENIVDLYYNDDISGRQQWTLEKVNNEYLIIANGRSSPEKYLGKIDQTLKLFKEPNINCFWNSNNSNNSNFVEGEQTSLINTGIDSKPYVFNNDLVIVNENIFADKFYLSVHKFKDIVDLYFCDDESGRQKWTVTKTENTEENTEENTADSYIISLKGGRKDRKKYLSYRYNNTTNTNTTNANDTTITLKIQSSIKSNCLFSIIDNKLIIPENTNLLNNLNDLNDLNNIDSLSALSNSTNNNDDEQKPKLNILLRGHIRTGFKDSHLFDFISLLDKFYNIHIYIRTWTYTEANRSWRKLNPSTKQHVSKSVISRYFKHLAGKIVSIIIDDDSKIKDKLVGKTIFKWKACLPLICWKFMWYGQHVGINSLSNATNTKKEYVLNTRFDIFNVVYNNLDHSPSAFNNYLAMISLCMDNNNDIRFTCPHNVCGIDNFYIGKVECVRTLIDEFHFNLDKHLDTMPPYQEHEVFITAHKLFNNVDGGYKPN